MDQSSCVHAVRAVSATIDAIDDFANLPILKELTWKETHRGIKGSCTEIDQLLNHVIILIKFMIFSFRGRGEPPTAREIKDKLLESRTEERKLAVERDTLVVHYRIWEALEGFLVIN